jgi:hypothetical protein
LGPDAAARVSPHHRRDDPARLLAHRAEDHPEEIQDLQRGVLRRGPLLAVLPHRGPAAPDHQGRRQAIIAAGDFPTVQANWPHIGDETFSPVGVPEDDLLTLLAEQTALAEDDWGAEYEDDDEGENT